MFSQAGAEGDVKEVVQKSCSGVINYACLVVVISDSGQARVEIDSQSASLIQNKPHGQTNSNMQRPPGQMRCGASQPRTVMTVCSLVSGCLLRHTFPSHFNINLRLQNGPDSRRLTKYRKYHNLLEYATERGEESNLSIYMGVSLCMCNQCALIRMGGLQLFNISSPGH